MSVAVPKDGSDEYRFGGFRLVPAVRRLFHQDQPVALSARAFDVLLALIDQRGQIVGKDALMQLVWPNTVVEENNLSVHISTLRKLLGHQVIATVPGRGYIFAAVLDDHDGRVAEVAAPAPHPAAPHPAAPHLAPGPPARGRLRRSSPLIGRDDDLTETVSLAMAYPLVSIVGTGGMGKTRLAQAVGERLDPLFPDGAMLVDLTPSMPGEILHSVAAAFGVEERPSVPLLQDLLAFLKPRELLLVLDNCEHVIADAAELVESLLAHTPGLSILTTSREPLRAEGEQIYRLGALTVPPAGLEDGLEAYGAVALFLARIHAIDRQFRIGPENARIVGEICRRLDGIPLAIELAAARVPMLGLEALHGRLDQRFHLLTGGSRTIPRHQTLRATLDWSRGLLDPAAAALFSRLAVFTGSFSLEAAVAVAAADPWQTTDTLAGLIEKSLVVVEGDALPRYRLLETIRAYAADMLDEIGQRRDALHSHASYLRDLFEQADRDWETTPDRLWLDRYAPERDNLRGALEWAFSPDGDLALGIELVAGSRHLWQLLSLYTEGRRWFTAADRLDADMPPATTGRVLTASGTLWVNSSKVRALQASQRATLALNKEDHPAEFGRALTVKARALADLGAHDAAEAALVEAQRLLSAGDLRKSEAACLSTFSVLRHLQGRLAEAETFCEQAMALDQLAGSEEGALRRSINLADIRFCLGDIAGAIACARSVVCGLRRWGHAALLGNALANLGAYLTADGCYLEARAALMEALPLLLQRGDVFWAFYHLAFLAACEDAPDDAARLIGYADAAFAAEKRQIEATERSARDRTVTALHERMPPPRLQSLIEDGSRWSPDQAMAWALAGLNGRPSSR